MPFFETTQLCTHEYKANSQAYLSHIALSVRQIIPWLKTGRLGIYLELGVGDVRMGTQALVMTGADNWFSINRSMEEPWAWV